MPTSPGMAQIPSLSGLFPAEELPACQPTVCKNAGAVTPCRSSSKCPIPAMVFMAAEKERKKFQLMPLKYSDLVNTVS